ncbi:glycine--tRNA ligase subunit beta [Halioxenophilus sp. WMMB6]|uniref:glycine--tRNA ligase subunit beta n=1 Tax=Halioxenophilus sp. WMMB6 TaxID=3073815 RepID=UPI00295E4644|nr:glycine--tRNA ligase subunit beta [Halioxenophilus sp. WMMB6]
MSFDFLVELGTEELPPKALKSLSAAFLEGICQRLVALDLSFDASQPLAAPRRLAVIITNLAEKTPEKSQQIWGPPANIAFDGDGNPTKAALAFASKNGVEASALATANDGKVDKLVVNKSVGGEATVELLAGVVEQSLAELPIPKRMRWGASRTEFVRPVHWLVMLYGDEIVPGEVLGLSANRQTYGHRFHYNQPLSLQTPQEYTKLLADPGYVLVDFEARQATIREQVNAAAAAIGGNAVIEDDLLDEVTALVEWPHALTGQFDAEFLAVPAEALISSMSEHQKYFHVVDGDGQLMPYFITIANIDSRDPAAVIAGNERVIRPRLADAAFFFETDKKQPFDSFRERLQTIVFQAQLGSLYQKSERIGKLAAAIADKLGYDVAMAIRAGELCKCDLASEMVLEFDKMQGIAGKYYAAAQGEPTEVAEALAEHYLPKFAGDTLPTTHTGLAVALADRLDTLVGIFGIGQQPTGSKDPFALRRASVAVLRLLIEKQLPLDLSELVAIAGGQYADLPKCEGLLDRVLGYMLERLRSWYEDLGISAEVFLAVAAKQLTTPLDIDQRIYAVAAFTQMEEAEALAAANKRVSNILAKEAVDTTELKAELLTDAAEQALAAALAEVTAEVAPLLAEADYQAALQQMAALRQPVDAFFDQVMVMTDDLAVRNNRLALLSQLRDLFLQVADISLLVPAKS